MRSTRSSAFALLIALLTTGCGLTRAQPSASASPPTISPPVVSAPAGAPVPTSPVPTSPATASPTPVPTPFPPLAAGAIPILYLHRVEGPPREWPSWTAARQKRFLAYDVIPAAFYAQLDWLKANGYSTILPRDLAAHWDQGTALPPRPVIITFDDGWPSWTETILPALKSRGMVAEFYLTLDAIARGMIGWDDVRRLARAGMGIGCHDVHHVQLAELGGGRPDASPATMWQEVDGCRVVVGQELGTPPDSMAYVGGGFDTTLMALVRQAGYTTARSILRGIDQAPSLRYELRVVAIGSRDDVIDPYLEAIVPGVPTFAAKMAGLRQ